MSQLRLTDFRSYRALDVALTGQPVAIFGPNGAGKTNLLEALSLLSPGRGLRRASPDSFLHKTDKDTARAWGLATTIAGDVPTDINLGCLPDAPRRRQLRLDGSKATGPMLAEKISALWLTPAQDRLFTGPASDRRKFLDRMCLAYHPAHGRLTLRYEKARRDRNRLLAEGGNDALWYEALEAEMATCGAQIAHARVETLNALSAALTLRPDSAFPKAALALDGEIEALCGDDSAAADVEYHFSQLLGDCRREDMRAGRSLRGVHKTDLSVTHIPKNMDAPHCSTGEQKALLIAMVLAHARALAQRRPGRALIVLLDEIAAHLDVARRAALAEELVSLPAHIFMTGTDESLFEAFGHRAQRLEIADSKVTQAQDKAAG